MRTKSGTLREKKALTQASEMARDLAKMSPAETAGYVASMVAELQRLTAQAELGFLAYLLGMVRIEAEEASRPRALQ